MAKSIKRKLISYTIKTSLLLSMSAAGVAATDSDMDTIVVTASGFEQQLTQAPTTISVVTKADLETRQVNDLAEALENIEGVDVHGSTGKTGGMSISIRGMPSEYTLVLVDGRRQSDTSDITPNGFGSMQTSFIPPISAVERIEVIKGPMSTLYGSDAMGGVVNIITKRVSPEWSASLKLDHTFMEDSNSGDKSNGSLYVSGPIVEDKIGLVLRSSVYHREKSERESSNGVLLSTRTYNPVKSTIYALGGRINFTPTQQDEIWLDLDTSRQKYDNEDSQLGTVGLRGYQKTLRFNRDQAAIGYTKKFAIGTWESSLMYKQTENKGRVIPTGFFGAGDNRKLKTEHTIFDTKAILVLGESHQLSFGGQWWNAEMEDSLVTKALNGNKFEQKTYATFVEDEWYILDSLALTAGLRYDHHDQFGSHYNPRAYLVWNTTDQITLKGGISKGYRTPTLAQLHDGISGVTGQGTMVSLGNPDLKPEKSTNYELGFIFNNKDDFSTSVTAFYNKFKDKIASGDPLYNCNWTGGIPPANCIVVPGAPNSQQSFSKNINIDEVDIYGLEFGSKYNFMPELALSLKYTYTHSEQKSGKNEGMPLNNTPKHMASAKLDWQINNEFSSWIQAVYRGKSDRFSSKYDNLSQSNKDQYDSLGDLKSYTVVNIGGKYKMNKNVTFLATIYNVLDKDFTKYGSYYDSTSASTNYASYYVGSNGTILEGRRLWLSANIDF